MVHGILGLSESEMVTALNGVNPGSKVFVSYIAGRRPSDRAIQEAQPARDQGISTRHYTGVFHSLHRTKKGDYVMTIWTDTRVSTDACGNQVNGAYRAINPNLGTLMVLEVLEHAPAQEVPQLNAAE